MAAMLSPVSGTKKSISASILDKAGKAGRTPAASRREPGGLSMISLSQKVFDLGTRSSL